MRLTREEFLAQPRKAITLIGMSGVGKSFLADKLAGWGWYNYSCDDLIGSEYLNIDNMKDLAAFVGQIGNPDLGGVGLEEFRRRQELYYKAECDVLSDIGKGLSESGSAHFVNDSSGSLCEVEDEDILAMVGKQSLFVYLKVPEESHAEILQRAIDHPKPLFFPSAFFDEHLLLYQEEFDVGSIEEIEPGRFLSWVFPHLFKSRLPKYQKLADMYGVTISSGEMGGIESKQDFLDKVTGALDEQ